MRFIISSRRLIHFGKLITISRLSRSYLKSVIICPTNSFSSIDVDLTTCGVANKMPNYEIKEINNSSPAIPNVYPSLSPSPMRNVTVPYFLEDSHKLSVEEILNIVVDRNVNICFNEIALSLKRLYCLGLSMPLEMQQHYFRQLKEEMSCQILFSLLMMYSRSYSSEIVADIVEFLCNFHVGQSDPVMIVFLQLLIGHLNDIGLDQAARLASLFRRLKYDCYQVNLFMLALPKLVELRNSQYEALTIGEAISLLSECEDKISVEHFLSLVEHISNQIIEENEEVNLSEHFLLLKALSNQYQHREACNDLIIACLDSIAEYSNELSYEELIDLLKICLRLDSKPGYLLKNVSESIEKNCSFDQKCLLIHLLNKKGFESKTLCTSLMVYSQNMNSEEISRETCISFIECLFNLFDYADISKFDHLISNHALGQKMNELHSYYSVEYISRKLETLCDDYREVMYNLFVDLVVTKSTSSCGLLIPYLFIVADEMLKTKESYGQRVALIILDDSTSFWNTGNPCAWMLPYSQKLEAAGYKTLMITRHSISDLSPLETKKYLTRMIILRCRLP